MPPVADAASEPKGSADAVSAAAPTEPSDTSLGARARFIAPKPPSPTIAALAATPLVRKPADREQITAFCRGRGWTIDTFDIEAINHRLGKLGHPGFDLVYPPARRGGRAA
jgi:hypothetical protein